MSVTDPIIASINLKSNPWPGGRSQAVAVVQGRLADLAAHFHVPIVQDESSLAVLLVVPGAGLMAVASENIDSNAWNPEPLTPEEVERMASTVQYMTLYVGHGVDANIVRSWVDSAFQPSVLAHFHSTFV